MKQIFVYIIVAVFGISTGGNVFALKKETKKTEKIEIQKKTTVKKNTGKADKVTRKKYDTFIDKNKNGIDDRRENLKSTKDKTKTTPTKEEEEKK